MKRRIFLTLCLAVATVSSALALTVDNLRVETMRCPSGIDQPEPQFSWQLSGSERSILQTSYQLVITTDAEGSDVVFDSGVVGSRQSVGIVARGASLQPATRYYWHVTVTDNHGSQATSTETACFDTGLMSMGWGNARWIKAAAAQSGHSSGAGSIHYRIDYDMYLVKASAGIIFAATSGNTYHLWQINCQDNVNPAVRRHTYINGNLTWNDAQFTQFTKADLLGHTRHYAIDVENGVVRTYIDGQLVDTFTDNTGTAVWGDIGMRVDNNTGEEAYYDNIVVTEYDAGGTPHIRLSEDFEATASDYFITATIEDFAGSRMCHVKSPANELKVMQTTTNAGVPVFRKQFALTKKVSRAMLFTACLGVYDLYLNGERVGHLQPDGTTVCEELKPGWSDFRRRAFYSTHDVSHLLRQNGNAVSAVVASGWYSGGIAHGMYGTDDQLALLAKLIITYEDGTTETIDSDTSWRSSRQQGLRYSDMYNGEIFDARLESDWRSADYDDGEWQDVRLGSYGGLVEAFQGPWVELLADHVQTVRKATVYEGATPQGGDYGMVNVVVTYGGPEPVTLQPGQTVVFDFGQNVVGRYRFTVRGQSGTRLHVRCSEMLNDNGQRSRGNDGPGGSLYLVNLRSARAESYYTLCGATEGEQWAPMTTFYGFRYVAMTATAAVTIDQISAEPLSSSTDETGDMATSQPMVNQLISNIVWGQRGNLLSVPTDCPQRDERQGWTADTQVYSRTGMYFANMETFYRKWMQDMRDGQRDDGAFPDTAPTGYAGFGSSAWADAGIIVPWYVYTLYGDKGVLRENFEAMERYMDWIARQTGEGYLYNGALTTYGDWLAYAPTDNRYVSVAYYAYDAQLMAKTCRALSEAEGDVYAQKAAKYDELFANIKAEFRSRYIKPTVRQNTQTAILMALEYDLLDGQSETANFINRITRLIRSNGYKLSTGFLGTAIINGTLSRYGQTDYAYDLLLQRQNPSWLYPIDQGATTMWERWNSYTLESGFGDPGMNSFNHYAYGAVGEWMFRHMLGIGFDEQQPGFSHILLQPQPDRRETLPDGQERITWARGHHQSRYGDIRSAWQVVGDGGTLLYECSVPANTTATLRLPVADAQTVVTEGGIPAGEADGIEYIGYEDGCKVYRLGSGQYVFSTSLTTAVKRPKVDNRITGEVRHYDLSGRQLSSAAQYAPGKGISISNTGRKQVMH